MKTSFSQTSRALAVEILCRWENSKMPADLVAAEVLAGTPIDHRDRQLTAAMVWGVIRNLRFIDHVLAAFSSHPLAKMKMLTRQVLRIGICQLLILDKIPPSAAVNETVRVLKERSQPGWLCGFANGVLRNIHRNRHTFCHDSLPAAVRWSHPQWLADRWRARYGDEKSADICALNNTPSQLWLRINDRGILPADFIALLTDHGIASSPGPLPGSLLLPEYTAAIPAIPGYGEGWFHVQDLAAQVVSILLGPLHSGDRCLDGCAGLGGKTCHLAQIADGAELVAVEPQSDRFQLLHKNLLRLGLSSAVRCLPTALGDLGKHGEQFSHILLDAPCSGLGVIRRHPDIRWNRNCADISRMAEEQKTLLDTAAGILAPGGCLVYAVCSMEPEEGEELVGDFLRRHEDFQLASCRDLVPETIRDTVNDQGFFLPDPTVHQMDGFFAARLEKKPKNSHSSPDGQTQSPDLSPNPNPNPNL